MQNVSEYDVRQLKLMLKILISFENKQIALHSLVGSLEFLLNALESVKEDWEEKFLTEITTLETINALSIIKDSGEGDFEIEKSIQELMIEKSIKNLNYLITDKLK